MKLAGPRPRHCDPPLHVWHVVAVTLEHRAEIDKLSAIFYRFVAPFHRVELFFTVFKLVSFYVFFRRDMSAPPVSIVSPSRYVTAQ